MKVLQTIKPVDLEKERSEHEYSLPDFIEQYNENLPDAFPSATKENLTVFKRAHAELFKGSTAWSLGRHRKKVMDWLPQHVKATALTTQ